jgi:xylulokinase
MYLGVDIGSSGIKAALVEENDVFNYSRRYPAALMGTEQDPIAVEQTFIDLLQEIRANTGSAWSRLMGIAFSGHGPSLVLIDETGKAITPIITWQDTRARVEEEDLTRQYPGFNWGGASFEGKLLWLMKNQPGLFEKSCTALYPKDYILHRISGEKVMDRSTASTIVWYDPIEDCWQVEEGQSALQALPRVVEPWAQIGVSGGNWSDECGIPNNVPLFAGGIDAYCETIGVGAIEVGDIVDGTGTSSCISMCMDIEDQGDYHVIPGRRIQMEMMSYTGGSLEWLLRLIDEDISFLTAIDKHNPTPLLFLPYLVGERSPIWDEKASGALVGLRPSSGREETAVAILQGCAFGVRQNLEKLETFTGKSNNQVLAAGGGAENEIWMQVKSDITGKRYLKPSVRNAAPLGCAVIAAYGRDLVEPAEACRRWVRIEKVFEPNCDPEVQHRYSSLYQLYDRLYDQLKETFWSLSNFE